MRARVLRLALLAVLASACGEEQGLVDVRISGVRGEVTIRAEVADEPDEQARGLMFRDELGARRGMLFVWKDVAPRSFYMLNTRIPLDLVGIRAGRVVAVYTMTPCPAEPCPRTETAPLDAALEVRAGTARREGIEPGSLVAAPHLR